MNEIIRIASQVKINLISYEEWIDKFKFFDEGEKLQKFYDNCKLYNRI